MKKHCTPDTPPQPITEQSIDASLAKNQRCLRKALIKAPKLLNLDIPIRPNILGEWFREGDYGFIFAPRGHGKTWLALLIGNAISRGAGLKEWAGSNVSRRTIYLDAEMNLPDMQDRARLIGIDSEEFEWLQHERVLEAWGRPINIALIEDQEALEELLMDGDVLIIDNLSTATHGLEENNNDDFDHLKQWLLRLRRRRISVVVIHHAGRNGNMRGGSRREDMAHWILSLKDDSGDEDVKSFVTQFVKCRNCSTKSAPPLRWTISTQNGQLTLDCAKHSGSEAMLELIRQGVRSANELARELDVTAGCVSKWAKRLMDCNPPLIAKQGRDYVLTEVGMDA
ncbi:MAG: AAA family ATPase [Verrucomicrobiales bacterium]